MSRKKEERKREREREKMPFIVATYVSASSQGQRTHSTRTNFSSRELPRIHGHECSMHEPLNYLVIICVCLRKFEPYQFSCGNIHLHLEISWALASIQNCCPDIPIFWIPSTVIFRFIPISLKFH